MRRLLLVLPLLLGIATPSLADTTISNTFRDTLAASPDVVKTAIVMLKGEELFKTEPPHSRASRRFVKETLMARSAKTAEPVVSQLAAWSKAASDERKRGGKPVRDVVSHERLWTINALIVKATGKALLDLAQLPDVARVIPDREMKLWPVIRSREDAAAGPFTYGLVKLGIDKVQNELKQYGEGVVIGILDTGIDANHPDLKGKVIKFKNFVATDAASADTPIDDHGHGTHCAGTIAGGNTSGTAIGVAPKAKLVIGKIFTGSGGTTEAAILSAMNWIADPDGNPQTDDTPSVCSNSWGGKAGSEESEKPMWDLVTTWIRVGLFPSFAAGNEGPGASTVGTPGGYPHAFAVGATDSNDKAAYFSSRGPISWSGTSYIKPEVSAPGVAIYSAKPGGGYQNMDGTSMATPHNSGLAGLLYSIHPDYTIEQVAALLKETAVDLGTAGTDNVFGAGRIDGYSSVALALKGGKVKVTLQDESGKPLAGRVQVTGGVTTQVSSTGTSTLLLVAGTYTLVASAFGYLDSDPVQVEVVSGQTVEKTFKLSEATQASLKVTVTDETTGAALVAKVGVVDTPIAEVQTGADGQAVLATPYGTYTIAVKAFAHETKIVANVKVDKPEVAISVALKHLPDILLLDRDSGKSYETFYKAALDALQKPYSYQTDPSGSFEEAIMAFPVVIYFTGDDYSNTVPDDVQAALRKYVASGGRLFITGQDIAYNLKSASFLGEVLHAKFVKDAASTREVSGTGLTLSIEGGDGAANQKYPDVIAIQGASGVETMFQYGGGEGPAGLFITAGTGKVVYLPFGFEGISTAANRQAVLDLVLKKLVPTTREKAARLTTLEQMYGADAGDAYRGLIVDTYEREGLAAQKANRGALRGLTPRVDR
ncbi:MAG: S8 family serine peptidase [Candidatus Riflebacteria bacterium]|nr:S8 family serine peptidase [Candidatus Riflebacteria bacterium]